MKRSATLPAVLAAAALCALPGAVSALSITFDVTPAYLKEHAKELSLKVSRQENGLVGFKLVRTLPQPRYLIARLVVRRDGEVVTETSIPAYGRAHDNSFYFSVAPRDLAGSEFELGEAHLSGSGADAVPIPGTKTYRFKLSEFAPPADSR
jgi:hypothetical protein